MNANAELLFGRFVRAYIECALWSSTDHSDESGGSPLDKNYSERDIAPETAAEMRADCQRFWDLSHDDLIAQWGADGDRQAGHDFWLTRNGHGAGFWESEWDLDGAGQPGETLDALAKTYGCYELYVGADGRIWGEKG